MQAQARLAVESMLFTTGNQLTRSPGRIRGDDRIQILALPPIINNRSTPLALVLLSVK